MVLNPGEVKTENIASGAVTTPKIADGAIGVTKLQSSSVTTEKIAAGAVTGSKLADNAVTGSKIRDNTVRAEKIAAGAITQAKIGEQQVTGSRIKDNAVTSEKIANNAVTTAKILDRSVTPAKLSFTPPSVVRPITPPVSSAELGTGSVESDKIADGAVTPAKLSFTPATRPLDPPIAEAEIGTYAVTYMKIAPNSVNDEKLSAGAVTPVKLDVTAPATDGQFYTYDSASGKFKPVDAPSGGSKITMLDAPVEVFTRSIQTSYAEDVNLAAVVPVTAKAVIVQATAFAWLPNTVGLSYCNICQATGGAGLNFARQCIWVAQAYPHVDGHYIIPLTTPQTMFINVVLNTADIVTYTLNVIGYIE